MATSPCVTCSPGFGGRAQRVARVGPERRVEERIDSSRDQTARLHPDFRVRPGVFPFGAGLRPRSRVEGTAPWEDALSESREFGMPKYMVSGTVGSTSEQGIEATCLSAMDVLDQMPELR